ncbi:VapE domain-containing protein [Sphingobium sp. DN12]|uniref:VapE domain-containing protein n=1 Tax=Sphingobium sp. DN12 TaxID=3378073 RepID=UPI003DA26736
MSYVEIINECKAELIRCKSAGDEIDPALIFSSVDWADKDVSETYFRWLVANKIATRAEINAARTRSLVAALLGSYPATCCEYVSAYAEMRQALVTYDGQVSVVNAKGSRGAAIITQYQTEARVFAAEHRLPFAREAINDAVHVWHEDKRTGRLDVIRQNLAPAASFDWTELALRCFDCSSNSPDFVAAILKKLVHQTKRKLHGLQVENHLMPVLLGPQGCGKTWFIQWLTKPVAEVRRDTDFRAIGDERNLGLWSSYVLVVDEMAFADRSDIETVKHVITADVLDRRPMRRNDCVRVVQCATLIGASNKSIGELIRDETGVRRFVGIDYRVDSDWNYLKTVDPLAAWRSVSEHEPDPMTDYRDQLRAIQAEDKYVSPVESWLEALSPDGNRGSLSEESPIAAMDLYNDYLSFFRDRYDGQRAKSMPAWIQETGRLIKSAKEPYRLEKHRTKTGVQWRWRNVPDGDRA